MLWSKLITCSQIANSVDNLHARDDLLLMNECSCGRIRFRRSRDGKEPDSLIGYASPALSQMIVRNRMVSVAWKELVIYLVNDSSFISLLVLALKPENREVRENRTLYLQLYNGKPQSLQVTAHVLHGLVGKVAADWPPKSGDLSAQSLLHNATKGFSRATLYRPGDSRHRIISIFLCTQVCGP